MHLKTREREMATTTKAANPWITHVSAFRTTHPDLSYKNALKQAKETYTRVVREERVPGDRKPNPWMQHIEKWKTEHPKWKEEHSYKEVLKLCKLTYKPSKEV
jgi:hypothetical protein